jgi:hypothetical protein
MAQLEHQNAYNKRFHGFLQVDESLFAKRKSNAGRVVAEIWIFGMCEADEGGLVHFESVVRRNEATLLPLISSLALPGAIISSDSWRAYCNLGANVFFHYTVNHKKHFVDPTTQAHTQRIESMWGACKLWKRQHGYKYRKSIDDYLGEFCFRYNCKHDFHYIWQNLYG